jgi:hypothetical protein
MSGNRGRGLNIFSDMADAYSQVCLSHAMKKNDA